VDLSGRLLTGDSERSGSRPVVLVVNTDIGDVGLKVDEIRRILEVELDSILPPPALVRGMAGRLFFGVVESGDDLHLLMDLDAILSADEKRELQQIPAGDL
jgi:purine-binding chemotaxis protein CheW